MKTKKSTKKCLWLPDVLVLIPEASSVPWHPTAYVAPFGLCSVLCALPCIPLPTTHMQLCVRAHGITVTHLEGVYQSHLQAAVLFPPTCSTNFIVYWSWPALPQAPSQTTTQRLVREGRLSAPPSSSTTITPPPTAFCPSHSMTETHLFSPKFSPVIFPRV